MKTPFTPQMRNWVTVSANVNLIRAQAGAKRCRSAYTGQYSSAAAAVAKVHEQCVALWQALVDRMHGKHPPLGDCPMCKVPMTDALLDECECLDARCSMCGVVWPIAECSEHSYKNLEAEPD